MSGGPVAVIPKDSEGALSWHVSGIIFEGHAAYNIVQAMRADWINEDGTVKNW